MSRKSQLFSNKPLVSVLLPVYNGSAYIKKSVQSILRQTYDNFELIIINDGSTDATSAIVKKIKDGRVKLYEQKNIGLPFALNRGIKLAKGEYIARQDHDDVALPFRFEKQVSFLEEHQDYGMVGVWAEIKEGEKRTQRVLKHPCENLILKFELLFDSCFVHSSVMIRKKVFEKIGLYSTDKSQQPVEDYELWTRISRRYKVANIPEILQIYREVPNSMFRTKMKLFINKAIECNKKNLASLTGKAKDDKTISDLAFLVHGAYERVSSKPSFIKISRLLYQAADKLSDSSKKDRKILRSRAKKRLQYIKSRYFNYKYAKKLKRLKKLFDKLKRFKK